MTLPLAARKGAAVALPALIAGAGGRVVLLTPASPRQLAAIPSAPQGLRTASRMVAVSRSRSGCPDTRTRKPRAFTIATTMM